MLWNSSRCVFRLLRLGSLVLATALLLASSTPTTTPPPPGFSHDAEQARMKHRRYRKRLSSLFFAHASPVPSPMTAPNANITPRGASRTGNHVSLAPMVQGAMAPHESGSTPRDLLGFLAGGGGGVGGGNMPAPPSHIMVGPPKSGNGASSGAGGTEASKAEPPVAGTKKLHKEKTPLLEGALPTVGDTSRGGGGTGQASPTVTGSGATAWSSSSEAGNDAVSSESVSAILTAMANGGGIVSEVLSFAHAKPTDAFSTVRPDSASTTASANLHSPLSATTATNSSTNTNNAPGTTRSELTEWKVIGVAVISITFIGILMLLITFFDSWWGFVRDVGACGGAGWGCEGLCCQGLPKEDEHGVGVKEERHTDSTNATDVGMEKGWGHWKRLSRKVWGSRGDRAVLEGDWWTGKDGDTSKAAAPNGVDWYVYADGDTDAVALPGHGSMEDRKGGFGDMVPLRSSGSVWKASTLQVSHQPRSQQGISVPVSVSRSASTSTSNKSVFREEANMTTPMTAPVQVQVQPPTPTTPPLSALPTLPSPTKLRQFLTGSPSHPGYPPFPEDPYVVGEVLRQTSAKRGGSRLKNVALPSV